MRCNSLTLAAILGIAGLYTAGCSSQTDRPAAAAQAPTGIHEITSLYELATAPHPQATRKPVRDQRNRAMRQLAEKAEAMAAETAAWESQARLAGLDAPTQDQVRDEASRFRTALVGLKTAAEHTDRAGVRDQYAAAISAYRDLTASIPATADTDRR